MTRWVTDENAPEIEVLTRTIEFLREVDSL
jgi:hypothetical protein